jgi:hypothetical protein
MMRKLFSVVFKFFAGMFLYLITFLAFANNIGSDGRWGMLAIFMGLAVAAMLAGLAVSGFAYWRRDTGIVLVSTAAFNAFLVLTMACLFSSDEFLKMLPPESAAMFNSYWTGGAVILGLAVLGGLLLKSATPRSDSLA